MGNKAKYSKTKLIGKRWAILVALILLVMLIGSISFIIYVNVTNNIVYENIKDESSVVNDDIASNSTPIIVNNIIVGGVYQNTWVSMERYFYKSVNKKDYDIDVYTNKGKSGSFKTMDVTKGAGDSAAYTTTTRPDYSDEYFAVKTGSAYVSKMDTITLSDSDMPVYKNYVKKALGIYGVLNNTVKIKAVDEVSLIPGQISYIITATNEGKTNNGVYSAVVFVDEARNCRIVKYNYVKNVKDASNFAIYTVKFVADLNSDSKCEIILQETKEFYTKYSVMEYSNNKFYEVISARISNNTGKNSTTTNTNTTTK